MPYKTKEEYAAELGVEVTDEDFQKYQAAVEADKKEAAELEIEPDVTSSDPTKTEPAKKEPDKPADEENVVYPKKVLEEGDPLRDEKHPLHQYMKKWMGDPVGDTTHPLHKPIADSKSAFNAEQTARQRAEARAKDLEAEVMRISGERALDPQLNDPAKDLFGGISKDDVDAGDATVTDWVKARDGYYRALDQRTAETERRKIANEREAQEMEKEIADMKAAYPTADPDAIRRSLSEYNQDGSGNPEFRPLSFSEGHLVTEIRKVGGYAKWVEAQTAAATEAGKKTGREEILAKIAKNGGKEAALLNADGTPASTVLTKFVPKTPTQIANMSAPVFKAYEAEREAAVKRGEYKPD